MKKSIIVSVLFASLLIASGQTIDLTFTAIDNESYVQLDSIKVMNRTQGGDTVLYWPDTILSLYIVGIDEPWGKESAFHVFQNYPNPVVDNTTVGMYVPEKDMVSILITDVAGRVIYRSEYPLDKGFHSFKYVPSITGISIFAASHKEGNSSIRILSTISASPGIATCYYVGQRASIHLQDKDQILQNFTFSFGDTLLFIGYTDTLQSGILDAPEVSETYTFQFATNIPCPGTPTVEYEGQVYNTIQIFSQGWLKENLNVGIMIPGGQWMSNDSIIEKYCYENEPDSCMKYGGLYQWNEMMQYITQQGRRGICPPGWHLPTDEEWKVLEGAVDSQYGIGDPVWDNYNPRGYDAGTNLKATSGWNNNGNGTNLFGFSGLPGGSRNSAGFFWNIGFCGFWWTSTECIYGAWYRTLYCGYPGVSRNDGDKYDFGLFVRCLRD
ncbi:MAG: hypothetical protein K8R63_02380 [Bacteroidales bacterium]|nr:hypothetical protein [Bacteroidales bacterium]